ncbi:MAG: DUF1643 domain-containing protein [Bacteroidia bacterium]
MLSDAVISPDEQYRYLLTRIWDKDKPIVNFIGLNPSTADKVDDDPTMRRCVAFAKSWGYGGLYMTNLFAFRATKPEDMMKAIDPIGKENDKHLLEAEKTVNEVVFAWGIGGTFLDRDKQVLNLITKGHYIALTKGGHPRHPLYLKSDLTIKKFTL